MIPDKPHYCSQHGIKGESVAEYLADAIQEGHLVPGQRLVEAELTAKLDISRSLLREAFRRLNAEGLIEIVPNRGACVRRLSLREALELFAIRTELECLAARLSAKRIADRCVRSLFEVAIVNIWNGQPRQSTAEYVRENSRFHAAIFEAAGNGELVKLNRRLQLSLIMAQISTRLNDDVVRKSLMEHRAIASSILDQDANAAETAMRAHLVRARDFVASTPVEYFRQADDSPAALTGQT